MLVQIFHIVAKRLRDPEIKRPPAEHARSFALYRHFRDQAGQGVKLEDIRPADDTSPAEAQALLRGTGIHFALLAEHSAWKIKNADGIAAYSDLTTERISGRRIDNPYLPPRPSFYS